MKRKLPDFLSKRRRLRHEPESAPATGEPPSAPVSSLPGGNLPLPAVPLLPRAAPPPGGRGLFLPARPSPFMFFADRHPVVNTGLRVLMAVFGGYGLALLAAAALAIGMPFSFRPDAVSLAIMLAFLLHLLVVIWTFAAATLLTAALGLVLPAGVFWLWLLSARGIS